MEVAKLIGLVIQASMGMIILSVALNATMKDLTYLLQKPGLLIRSLTAMYVIMPLFAIAIALLFDLNVFVEAALIALALSPVPPVLPRKELKAGGAASYTLGLFAIAAIVSIFYVPLAADMVGRTFGQELDVSTGRVAGIVATSVLLALVLGVAIRAWAPTLADRLAKPAGIIGTVLLVIAAIPILIKMWPEISSLIGNFTIVAIVGFVLVGLLVGHLLGGPDPEERTVLALSTATRHPAIALAILYRAEQHTTVMAAVLLAVLVGTVASAPYVKWRRRVQGVDSPRPA
jgi:BASS family bile acid:Na+ symporter